MACIVFHKTRQIYFNLGFIDNNCTEKKDIHAREKIVENIHDNHYDMACCKVFGATRTAYFDLGFKIRRALI